VASAAVRAVKDVTAYGALEMACRGLIVRNEFVAVENISTCRKRCGPENADAPKSSDTVKIPFKTLTLGFVTGAPI
jgi:hypothetical protein